LVSRPQAIVAPRATIVARLDEIAAFVEVVERGSFKAAATSLGISVSVVSRRVQALEERLGVGLLHRTTRRLRLSDVGRELHAEVRGIPRLLEDAEERARARAARPSGLLRVVMPAYFASSGFHHRVVPEYLRAHPEVALTFTTVADPAEHLHEDWDVVVVARALGQRMPETAMVGRKIHELEAVLFAAPAYLEARGKPRTPEDLLGHNCLSYPDRRWRVRDPKSRREVVLDVRGTLTTNSNAVLWAATMNGIGIASSFVHFFDTEVERGQVVTVLDAWTRRARIGIWAFHRGGRFVPRRARAFLDMLRAHFERR
jgi:DNA-binding transcriptional LysR family regulator